MYPWNAGPDEGREASLNEFGQMQIHITADVAWGLIDYLRYTGDDAFFDEAGWEILAGCARFWADRVEDDGGIRGVIGPDERAIGIDNNAFTNRIAAWVLREAADRLASKVDADERDAWLRVADRIVQQRPNAEGVIEQYDGYFDLPQGDPQADAGTKFRDRPTQTLKQADVLMLPFVFPEEYPTELLEANFEYYRLRNSHRSSLSLAPHCVAAVLAGQTERAHEFYTQAGSTDLRSEWPLDGGGLHAAACAALPLALLHGFAGMRRDDERLQFTARLPKAWSRIAFQIDWQGRRHHVELTDGQCASLP
jgi:trehalose/maltose hydrolase-like predicted phosphorylase